MAAKLLIEAGADQTARDNNGRNMLHYILTTYGSAVTNSAKLTKTLIEILDPHIVPALAQQRSRLGRAVGHARGYRHTPLAEWLMTNDGTATAVFKAILDMTGGKELYILNEQGNYPIHDVTRGQKIEFVRVLLERDPCLAVLENATGVTPLEVAENKLVAHLINEYHNVQSKIATSECATRYFTPPCLAIYGYFNDPWRICPEKFDASQIYDSNVDKPLILWEECKEGKIVKLLRSAAAKSDKKRILVSLHDANELVRRLSVIQQNIRGFRATRGLANREDDDEEPGEEDSGKSNVQELDEVNRWLGSPRVQTFEETRILEEEKAELKQKKQGGAAGDEMNDGSEEDEEMEDAE